MAIRKVVICDGCANHGSPAIDSREARRSTRARGIRRVRAGRFSGGYRAERVIWVDLCDYCRTYDGLGRFRRSLEDGGLTFLGA